MKTAKDWMEFGASTGIIAGLVMVGFQMKQNSELLRTQLLFEEAIYYTQSEEIFLGENPAAVWAKSIEAPEDLSLEEQRVLEAYYWSAHKRWENLYRLSESGLIDDEWRSRVAEEAPYLFGHPYAYAWWQTYSATEPDDELTRLISSRLAKLPRFTIDYHREHREAYRRLVEE
ncbi:MAG: hypothetical protein AAGE01_07490 [Pseudomonadota bacterium]